METPKNPDEKNPEDLNEQQPTPRVCRSSYCIYNRDEKCLLLNPPAINFVGMCEAYDFTPLDKDFLDAEKDKILKRQRNKPWAKLF